MSTLQEAARRALTALNIWHGAVTDTDWKMDFQPEIDALRDALAEDRLNEMQAAVLAEREACAAICAREARRYGDGPELEHFQQGFGDGAWVSPELEHFQQGFGDGAWVCAAKIRARGQE